MKRTFLIIIHCALISSLNGVLNPVFAQALPIIDIQTNGEAIPNEPKINVSMRIFESGSFDDTPSTECTIGIEKRGNSSQNIFPKKPFGFETRDREGENLNISLLGLPVENDWVLYAPYDDKSLIRNALSFELFSQLGWYTPRKRFCDLYINDDYKGIYELTEKIKRDQNRVDIKNAANNGFIIETVPENRLKENEVYFKSAHNYYYVYKYPEEPEVSFASNTEIVIDRLEQIIYAPNFSTDSLQELSNIINIENFVDYTLFNEAIRNLDAFFASTYWYADSETKLSIGPLWDCDISLGNADYGDCWKTDGFRIFNRYYPGKLYTNTIFRNLLKERWAQMRNSTLSNENVIQTIDSLVRIVQPSVDKNFERWNILGRYVWPNYYIGYTYEAEVAYLKNWFIDRLNWMDYKFEMKELWAKSMQIGDDTIRIDVFNQSAPCILQRSLDNVTFETFDTLSIDDSSYFDLNIEGNKTYHYLISEFSDSSENEIVYTLANTKIKIPEPPSYLIVEERTDTSAQISWNDNSYNETNFEIEYTLTDDSISFFLTDSNTTEYFIQIPSRTTVRVCATNPRGKSEYSNLLVIHNTSSSPDETIAIYPSVCKQTLKIYIGENNPEPAKISIFDTKGYQIKNFTIESSEYFTEYIVNTSELDPGLYSVHLSNNTINKNLKFIKE